MNKLSDAQKAAADYARANIPMIKDTPLIKGVQDDLVVKFQFKDTAKPATTTFVNVKAQDQDFKTWALSRLSQKIDGESNGSRIKSESEIYAVDSFDQAISDLKWA